DHESESLDDTSVLAHSNKKQKIHEFNFDEIWTFYLKGSSRSNGHYKASCYYCLAIWKRENHNNYWHHKLIKETNIVHTQTNNLQDMDCFSSEDLFKKLKYDPPSRSILFGKAFRKISNLIEDIGSEKFAIVVTDAASNC
ncbi:17487_t:CDS:2, partial [Gigaspora margarita]